MRQCSLSESDTVQTRAMPRASRVCWRAIRTYGLLFVGTGAIFLWVAQFAAGVQKAEKQLHADTVTAGRFELVSANGRKAALLSPDPHGGALMSFYDEKGVMRLGVGVSDDTGPELMLYDRTGQRRLSVAIRNAIGFPSITLFRDSTGDAELFLTAHDTGASISLNGKQTSSYVLISLDADGEPLISMNGPGKKHGLSLSADGNGQHIMLIRGDRSPVSLGLGADGSPALQLEDLTGKVSSTVTLKPNGETTIQRVMP